MAKFYLLFFLVLPSFLLFSQQEKTFHVQKRPSVKIAEKEFHRTFFISLNNFLLDTGISVGDTIRMKGQRFPLGKCTFTISNKGEIFKAEMLQGVVTPALLIVLKQKLFKSPTAICFAEIQEVKTTKGVVVSKGGQAIVKLLF